MAARFAKAPAGIHVSSGATKGGSAKEGGRPPAPPGHLERPPPPDFAKRTAVLVPCQDFAVLDSPFFFRKGNQGGKATQIRGQRENGSGQDGANSKGEGTPVRQGWRAETSGLGREGLPSLKKETPR